jgi:hypothetical protein
MTEQGFIWLERIYNHVSRPSYQVSAFSSVLLLCLFIIFRFTVPILTFDFWHGITIGVTCLLVGWQQFAIISLLRDCSNTIQKLDCVIDDRFIQSIYIKFEKLYKTRWVLLINILIITPFICLDVFQLIRGEVSLFYLWVGTSWSLLLDIYNYFLSYLINYFLSIQLFINFSIVYLLRDLDKMGYKNYLKFSDLEKPDLRIANLLSTSVMYYFLSLALAIASYIGPFGLITAQSIIYILLIVIGLSLFLYGRKYIIKIFKDKIKDEVNMLADLNESYYERFIKNASSIELQKEDLLYILLVTNITNIQIDRRYNMKINIFNFQNIIKIIVSFASSVIAVMIRMMFATHLVNLLSSIFHTR